MGVDDQARKDILYTAYEYTRMKVDESLPHTYCLVCNNRLILSKIPICRGSIFSGPDLE